MLWVDRAWRIWWIRCWPRRSWCRTWSWLNLYWIWLITELRVVKWTCFVILRFQDIKCFVFKRDANMFVICVTLVVNNVIILKSNSTHMQYIGTIHGLLYSDVTMIVCVTHLAPWDKQVCHIDSHRKCTWGCVWISSLEKEVHELYISIWKLCTCLRVLTLVLFRVACHIWEVSQITSNLCVLICREVYVRQVRVYTKRCSILWKHFNSKEFKSINFNVESITLNAPHESQTIWNSSILIPTTKFHIRTISILVVLVNGNNIMI